MNQLSPLARAVSPDQVNRILVTLLEAFDGNEANFDGLVRDLDVVMATLAERDDTIAQLLGDYEAISTAVASRDGQIEQMVQNLVAISSTFSDNDELLDRALVELAGVSEGLDRLLSDERRRPRWHPRPPRRAHRHRGGQHRPSSSRRSPTCPGCSRSRSPRSTAASTCG